jgi:glucosyl-dolichyl phosphate glucuronosyltransferase
MLTVIFSSYNGSATLPAMLQSLMQLRPVRDGVRFIAVDNASTDETSEILQSFQGKLPLTVLAEPRRGKNRALNRAIEHAVADLPRGKLIVFTDDDVVVESDWLQRLDEASRALPDHHMFGGAILPTFRAPPPKWLSGEIVDLGMMYAITSRETGSVGGSFLWGPNMAVRGELLSAGHRFEESVGPDGTSSYAMGSDTEFTVRLERAGFRAWFVGDAVVRHIIRPEQVTEEWLIQRGFRHGRGICRCSPPFELNGRRVFGLPAALALRLVVYGGTAVLARHLPASRLRFRLLYRERWLRGVAHHVLTSQALGR